MKGRLTAERFAEVKKALNTPILIDPPLRMVAQKYGLHSSTVSEIKRFDSFEEYRAYQKGRRQM